MAADLGRERAGDGIAAAAFRELQRRLLMAFRSLPSNAWRRRRRGGTPSSAGTQSGAREAIWASVVQRKEGATWARSITSY